MLWENSKVLGHVTTMSPISKHSVYFECNYPGAAQAFTNYFLWEIQKVLGHVTTVYSAGIFPACLEYTEHM